MLHVFKRRDREREKGHVMGKACAHLLSGLKTESLSCLSGLRRRLRFSALWASPSLRRGIARWTRPIGSVGWLSLLVTVLPLASESRELMEPLMWEPLDSRLLPDGKGSLGAGERQRGIPPSSALCLLDELPVGDRGSWEGWETAEWKESPLRSTSSPFTELWSEHRLSIDPSPIEWNIKE